MRIMVFGASGFVGSAVSVALTERGAEVIPVRAPRLAPVSPHEIWQRLTNEASSELAAYIRQASPDAVVNAAGIADAGGLNERELYAANALLPALLAKGARAAGIPRYIHVSSAAVQGRLPTLDESARMDPFSPYARSKAVGEQLVRRVSPHGVIYRPPGVHGPSRGISQSLTAFAASPLSSVSYPASAPTPQAHIANVADAIAYLALCEEAPPQVVMHPWEGHTTGSILTLLGGRAPVIIPKRIASAVVEVAWFLARRAPSLAANARRLEMLWFGQKCAGSWLEAHGWRKPAGLEAWRTLADRNSEKSENYGSHTLENGRNV